MQTKSKYQFQAFEHSGNEVRFHWNIQQFNVEDDPDLHYSAEECLSLDTDSDAELQQKLQAEQCPEELQQVLISEWNTYKGTQA